MTETRMGWGELAERWLKDDGPAAVVCREWLVPVGGRDSILFPPTFAADTRGQSNYNVDTLGDGTKSVLIDSVGAQANRMEPLFKDEAYVKLVPQIVIKAGDKAVSLLDAGHRAADAIVRYSPLGADLRAAFLELRDKGDARKLAKLAPTSLVFGAWDSRDTETKIPRLLASTIRAYGAELLTRSAQYNPPVDYIAAGLIDGDDKQALDAASSLGFRHAPATGALGGVIARKEIRREVVLSLVALRALGPAGEAGAPVRRYILGLALVAMTYERPFALRQGCLLVRDADREGGKPSWEWETVAHTGKRETVAPDHGAALKFAQDAAAKFGVGDAKSVDFDRKGANAAIADEKSGEKKKGGGRKRGSRGGAKPEKNRGSNPA
ncbi:MAG: type I-U CRISPR-associated protein Cas7 [Candidatus Rokubacteria bacterium]|nr:type I-U CRISPR-associated protein Cas7 [Candidatus Rokubacteria bacterium]